MLVRRTLAALTATLAAVAVALTLTAPAQAAPTRKGSTAIVLDPTAAAALGSLGVAVGVAAPASAIDGGLSCPVVGNPAKGVIKHVGGLTLSTDGAGIALTNFWIDPARGVVSGLVDDAARVDLFTIGSTAVPGTVSLALTPAAAGALNQRFGVDAFVPGFVVATATPHVIA